MAVPRKKVKRRTQNVKNSTVTEKKGAEKAVGSEAEMSLQASARNSGENGQKAIIISLQAGTPIYVKTADICAATGKTNQWIGQLTAQGVINKEQTSRGPLYNFIETMKAYCAMIEGKNKELSENVKAIEKRKLNAETKFKESKAQIEEMKAKEFQGKMHRSEDVQAMTADLLYYVRGSLVALAGRCATECAASSEPAEVQKIIEKEVFAILKDLTEYKYSKKRYEELVRRRESAFEEFMADEEDE